MKFTLAQLEAFFWVAHLGSVQQAARRLNLAQPTVSLRLKDLETALGRRLFERAGRRMRVATDSEDLLEHATRILEEAAALHEQTGAPQHLGGVVRLGLPETFALVCMPRLLNLVRQNDPELRLELVISTSDELERDLLEYRLDLAMLVNPLDSPALRLRPLGIQATSWVATPDWGLGPSVRPGDLAQLPIVTTPHPSAMHRNVTSWFRNADVEPTRLSLCNSVMMIAHLVMSGVAIGFLPLSMIEEQIKSGRLGALKARPPVERARVYAAHPVDGVGRLATVTMERIRSVLDEIDFLQPL